MSAQHAADVAASVPLYPSFLTAAQPHLDKVSRDEALLIIGGLVLPFILLFLLLRSVALPHLRSQMYTFTTFWLLLCAVIHSFLELHFVYFRDSFYSHGIDLYAAADFRYGRPLEAGTAAMEWITAVIVGPLCALLVYAIVTDKPWRHALQITLCTAQVYGLVWFAVHPFFYHLPVASDDPFLFYFFFVGLNAPWGIFPPILLAKSFSAISRQFTSSSAPQAHTNGKKHR